MATRKPGISPALEKIVFKAMAKDPKQRYGGCGEFAIEIERYLKQESSEKKTWARAVARSIVSPVRRAPRFATALMVIVIVLAGGASIGLRPSGWLAVTPTAEVTPTPRGEADARGKADARGAADDSRARRRQRCRRRPAAIRLMASVEPESVSQAGTNVTFRYEVTNGGREPLKNVTILDGGPTPPALVGGDTNGNGALDAHETWQFQSRTTIEQQHLDRGTLSGMSWRDPTKPRPIRAIWKCSLQRKPGIAISTLVNGAKSVNLSAPGMVSYTYFVTNTGNVRLTSVRVQDDQGASPKLRRGDDNGNKAWMSVNGGNTAAVRAIPQSVFAAGEPVLRRAFAVSDQLRSDPDEVTVRFERPVDPCDQVETYRCRVRSGMCLPSIPPRPRQRGCKATCAST